MHKMFSVVLRRVRQLPAYVAHANEFLKGRYAALHDFTLGCRSLGEEA